MGKEERTQKELRQRRQEIGRYAGGIETMANRRSVSRNISGEGNNVFSGNVGRTESGDGVKKKSIFSMSFGSKRKKAIDEIDTFSLLVKMFGFLIKDGTSPHAAIGIMAAQTEGNFGEILEEVKMNVDSGMSLSDAFDRTEFFPSEFCGILTVGEKTGKLADSLEMYSEYVEKVMTMKKTFMSALSYPTMVFAAAIAMAGGVLFFLTPSLMTMLKNMKIKVDSLPAYSQFLVMAYEFSEKVGRSVIITILAIIIWYIIFGKGKEHVSKLLRVIPKIRKINDMLLWSQWLMLGAICLKSGMLVEPMLETLSKTDLPEALAGDVFDDLRREVNAGHNLSTELLETKTPRIIPQMIGIAEKTGRVEDVMQNIARMFLGTLSLEIKGVGSIIEPVVIGFVSVFVGGLVAMVIFTMMSVASRVG